MFKKFKDKLAEEMKQSPARLQASMQQLAQAVVSPAISNSSVQELSTSNDNFSLTEEGDETPKNSPARHGFQDVDLISPISNSIGISRRSSISSITSDSSSLFPIYESPANLYHLQSDMDQSASEIDENISPQLDKVSKDQIYSAYRKVQAKYHKYRGRYTDLATHYKELERVKGKLESVLVETQDKVLRRIADLKEQCQLEQQAKAHLEEALRNDIEEKDHIINTLNTKIKLLQATGPNLEATISDTAKDQKGNLKDLIDLNTDSTIDSNENALVAENAQLKDKLKKLENVVLKYKDSLKRNKEKFTEVMTEKNTLESECESFKNSYAEKEKELNNANAEIKDLTEQIVVLKKREEESAISLAENKLSIHRELEDKEEQIKKLQLDLKHVTESKDNLSEVVNKYKVELEQLKSLRGTQNIDSEKRDVLGKAEGSISDETNSRLKSHEDHDEAERSMKKKIEELQTLTKEYQIDKEKLCMELSSAKQKCTELQNEHDAHRIVADEKRREAEATVEKLQATIHSLDKELENMRNALIDRDKVCESYNAKVQEYAMLLEQNKEKLLSQGTEIKNLNENILRENTEINKLRNELDDKNTELMGLYNELQSCKSLISDHEDKLKANSSNVSALCKEKDNFIKHILNYKNCAQILKRDNLDIKNHLVKQFTDFSSEISVLQDTFDTFVKVHAAIRDSDTAKLEIKSQEFEELKQRYDQLQVELKETTSAKTNLTLELEKCNKELNEMFLKMKEHAEAAPKAYKLVAEIDNLNFKLHELRLLSEEVEPLREKTKSLMEQLDNANRTNHLLSNEVDHLKAQLEEVNSKANNLEDLRLKYDEATETIKLLKHENTEKCNEFEMEISALRAENKQLNENLLERHKELSNLNGELQNKDRDLVNLKTEDDSRLKLIEEYREEIAKLTDSNKTLQQTVQTKLTQLKKLKAMKQQQDATIQKLNDEIGEVKALNAKLTDQLETLEKEIDTLKSENCRLVTLKNNNETITSELEQLKLIQNEISLENKNLKDKQNEFLKHNQELNESNDELRQKIIKYEEHNRQLLTENTELNKEIESYKNRVSKQDEDIDNLKKQITLLSTDLKSITQSLNGEIKELISSKETIEKLNEHLTKENESLQNEVDKLNRALQGSHDLEEKNKELTTNVELLNKEIARLATVEVEANNARSEICKLKTNLEEMRNQNDELLNMQSSLKDNITELENVNSANAKLQSCVNNLESKISSLEQVETQNDELKRELDVLKNTNAKLGSQIENADEQRCHLITEIDELKHMVDEKVAELIVLDNKNMELLKEIERLKDLMEEGALKSTNEHLEDRIIELQEEINILKEANNRYQEETQNGKSQPVGENHLKNSDRLQEENKKLEAQLDEALITFQAKELQMQIANNELKSQADKLKEELRVNEEEQSMRLKQLVKEFQAQLHDKEEELHAALEKRFDRQQNYESNLIQQYKEQLKDFQVELTTKSEQIENLILENKNMLAQKAKDINQLMEKITFMKKEHTDEIREIEKKWKAIVQQKTDKLEAKHEEEINELTREWRNERRPDVQSDLVNKELESTSRVAMAAVQSNTGSFHTLQQTLTAQRRELAELRKLVKLRHDTLEDSTEIEYLRNILFEYMMGRETMVLARVIAAVVKFDQEQTAKILKKEEDKMTLLGSLGLT